jgi:lysyl-tRNA synthetase class 2
LEWYEVGKNYLELMATVERMVSTVAQTTGTGHDLSLPWTRITMREAWQKYVGVDLNDFLTYDKISKLAQDKGYTVNVGESYDDLFFKIFLTEIEPKIAHDPKPVFLYDYPAQMAALSRLKADDARYAERFELYLGGLELANAYGELTDADEQAKRFEADVQKRAELNKPVITPDPELIQALKQGVPPVSGIALGIDRLIMVLTGAKDIEEVIPLSANNLFK